MEASFSRRLTAIFACVLLLFSAAALFGQGIVTGSINGTVEDQQHAVVPGATVTAVSTATNTKYTTTTNNTGYFSIASLPAGVYNLSVEAPKFSKLAINGVQVNANVATSLGARALSVGTETVVTVADTAPLIQTETSNISSTFDTKKAADLPIGNGFDSLALLTPGIADSGSIGGALANTNGAGISANGQRGRSNNFELDGQANNDNSISGPSLFFGNQDAIQEVQVLTNYDAQYGRNMGDVVNYVTKAGTNAYHGTGYEIYNGNWADAMANENKNPLQGFCNPGQNPGPNNSICTPPVVPRYVDNRFGGTMGGPILKDKLWFFGSGNFERQRIGASPNSSGANLTPDTTGLAQLDAAFPGNAAVAALKAIGPTGVTVGGNVSFSAPQTLLVSNNAATDCTATPAACVPVEFAVANRTLSSIFNDYEGTGRIDYQITPKDRFFGRYLFQQTLSTNLGFNGAVGNAQGDFVDLPARDQQIGLDYVRNWTSNFLNQLRFSYSRARFFFEGGAFPNCVAANIHDCPTHVTIGSTDTFPILGIGIATNEPQGRIINVYQYQDNATWVWGRHTFKFGGEYDRQRSPNVFLPNTNGSLPFANFNAFLANVATNARLTDGSATQGFKENDLAFYGQDDWRLRDNFTLTLGLRWEWNQQAINLLHDEDVTRESNPATAFWDTTLPLSLRTVPHIPQDLNNFAPVVGFAYTPRVWKGLLGEDKTVIRGGFRIAYDPEFYNMFLNVATSTPTVNAGLIPSCPGCLPASGTATDTRASLLPLVPTGTNPGLRTWTTVAPNFHNPYTEQWNLGVQREITHNIVGEVRYVGNHDVGLFQDVNANPALNPLINAGFGSVIPAGLTPCTTAGAPGTFRNRGYVDCTKTNVLERGNTAFSSYHGLQSQLRISNWHGTTAGVSYTWSHTIDNASDVFSLFSGGSTVAFPQNPFNGGAGERGNSGQDFPNVASTYVIYDTPWYKSQNGWVGRLLGGWEINPVWRFTSGQPYTVIETRFIGFGNGSTICDPTATFSSTFSACRPFLGNPSAPLDSVGACFNAAGCGLVNFNNPTNAAGNPIFISPSTVHWIVNDSNSEAFFGTPFGNVGRNSVRGDTINQVNLSLLKNVKVNERLTVQLRGVAYNVLNRMFRGVPDPIIDDTSFNPVTNPRGSFSNTFQNISGGDSANPVFNGIGRRRIEVGAKLIF